MMNDHSYPFIGPIRLLTSLVKTQERA